MVDKIGFLWAGSACLVITSALHWKLCDRRVGIYMLYLCCIASTYTIGMTLRHFEVGSLFVRDQLPDRGFVVWQSMQLSLWLKLTPMKRRVTTHSPPIFELRLLGPAFTVVLAVTVIDEYIQLLNWVDMAAFFASVVFAALPLPPVLRQPTSKPHTT